MSSIEELTVYLNACKHPRAVYNALMALASNIDVQNAEDPRDAISRHCAHLVKREVPHQEVKNA